MIYHQSACFGCGEGLVRSFRRNSKRSAASAISRLSLRARLRLPKKIIVLSLSSIFSTAARIYAHFIIHWMRSQHSPTSTARRAHNPVHISSAPEDKKNGYKKDIFGFLITGFELSYSITAEPCMESVTCYGMESMQSIVWNQAARKYTFGDAIRLRQFHTR